MIRRSILLAGLVVIALAALLWVGRNSPSMGWRKELVKIKLNHGLPSENWTDVIKRITPGSGGLGSSFEGLPLDLKGMGEGAVASGRVSFEYRCAGCHGQLGGGGEMGVSLADRSTQASLTDLDIYKAITTGRGTEMPIITGNVKEALQIAAYVRALGERGQSAAESGCKSCESIDVSAQDIADNFAPAGAGTANWLSYAGDYSGRRFSPLTQINKSNVSKLRTRFVYQTPSPIGIEAVPLVVNDVMILTGTENQVMAIDLESGDLLWEYRRPVAEGVLLCCGRRNRGVAVLGNRVFHNTLDGRLVALDIRNGKELWNVQVVNYKDGYTMTGAPLAIKDKIVVGVAGGDFGAPGVIDAYDAATGARLWRFDTVAKPGQPGHETWQNDGWKQGGGATWVTGTYDPGLGLVYWGVGNPAKVFNPGSRPGDNLYTSSVVALDEKTGALRWHYQFTPNDGNDWDATSVPVLADARLDGVTRKLMLFANRNCFFYALDRVTGKFLHASAYCEQNWNDGFTPEGRPLRRAASISSPGGPLVKPGVTGGSNWMAPSYDARQDLFFVKNYRGGNRFFSEDIDDPAGGRIEQPEDSGKEASITAVHGLSGAVAWEFKQGGENNSGLLATAGGIIFTGDSKERLSVLDAATGSEICRYRLGGQMAMAPITYLHHGVQEIAVISGGSLFVMNIL